MKEWNKLKDLYEKLNFILSKEHKKLAVLIMLMAIIAAILEMLGVTIIVPIMDMMINIEASRDKWYLKTFIDIFNLDSNGKIVWFVCISAISIYILKNLYFIFYNWVSLKYSYKVQRELSARVLRAYMRQGYIFFVENNSARLLQGIGSDVTSVYNILSTFFSMLTKFLTILCIGLFILFQSKEMAVMLLALAIICIGVIQLIYRKSMRRNGEIRRDLFCECSQVSIEAVQGNKEILVMNKQDYFVDYYAEMLAKRNKVAVKVDLGTISPAYIIEMICIIGMMLAVAIQMGNVDDAYSLFSQLSTIAIAAFRILPALGGITSGINNITMNIPQLMAAYQTLWKVKELEKLDQEKKVIESKYHGIEFEKEIEIKDIRFQYPNTEEYVLDNVNITIKKGQSVAFVGPSGAGKTTLSDIILSLLKPSSGTIKMDGIDIEDLGGEWSKIIGYVPQIIYVVDDTIRHNIAFGENVKDIDDERIWKALKIAKLDEFVKSLPENINTRVGEFGVRFSGGQRQRLAIARALYREPEILILDEATAALDNETESEVMKAIEALQGYKTLIIVAHRLTTVKKCDIIYEVRDKRVEEKNKEEILSV